MQQGERNFIYRLIGKIVSFIVALAVVFLLGIAVASWVKGTTFTIEWANMIAWFKTWAK